MIFFKKKKLQKSGKNIYDVIFLKKKVLEKILAKFI
jgi:hypothetical protein